MPELTLLLITAASIGFFHTLFGPDHYLPFIVMAQSGKWSMKKTFMVTFFSGVGHVLGSVVLGFIGIGLGLALGKIQLFEALRGDLAAWMLVSFGLAYFVWGVRKAFRNETHTHLHAHSGDLHQHQHTHQEEHLHLHQNQGAKKSLTPWVIFLIFLFGPCESLIPLLMYPAVNHNLIGLIQVVVMFMVATIGTMLAIVILSTYGLNLVPDKNFERYSHALAGMTIFICGISIKFLGL